MVTISHYPSFWLKTSVMAAAVTIAAFASPVKAQQAPVETATTVEIPLSQLEQIQKELRELRARDQQRQAWEHEFSERLTQAEEVQLRAAQTEDELPPTTSSFPLLEDACIACDPPACRCARCKSRILPAPCLECPHVSTASPYFNLQLFGALNLDMLFNDARPVSPGVPFFLAPDSLTGLNQNTVDIHARQTALGAALAGPTIGGFQSGGMLIGMFFNDNITADQYGFLPLQAFGELKNQDWRFSAGLQFDVFAPSAPTILPFSALAASGNAGNSFRGSVRLERYLILADDVQWTFQSALSDPITTTISPLFALNEDNGWPNVEGRIALGLGRLEQVGLAAQRPFEIGLSGVVGQIRNTLPPPGGRVVADVWGVATDLRWRVNKIFGFAGEVYTGQALGTYNGAILQTVHADTFAGIRSTGGWLEGVIYLTPSLHSHTGYGVDNPRDADVSDAVDALGRTFNSTLYSNLIWNVNAAFRIGFEVAWRETQYKAALNPNNEGIGFHTQFQWSF